MKLGDRVDGKNFKGGEIVKVWNHETLGTLIDVRWPVRWEEIDKKVRIDLLLTGYLPSELEIVECYDCKTYVKGVCTVCASDCDHDETEEVYCLYCEQPVECNVEMEKEDAAYENWSDK